MLTLRDGALLSLRYLRTKPDADELAQYLLDEDSFEVWDSTPVRVGRTLFNAAVRNQHGADLSEILALVDILDEFESAITYDCLSLGMRLVHLGTESFTWGELLAIVTNSPRSSAFYRAQNPEWMWDEQAHLLAAIADALHVANWQRSEGNKSDYPTPIPRPGVTNEDSTTHTGEAVSIDDMNALLGW